MLNKNTEIKKKHKTNLYVVEKDAVVILLRSKVKRLKLLFL